MFAVTRIPSVSSVNVTCPRTFPFGAGLRTATALGRTLPLGAPVSVPVRLSELLAQPAPNAIQLIMSEWTNSFIDISLPGETFAAGHNFLLPRILNDCRLRRKPPCPHKTLIPQPCSSRGKLAQILQGHFKVLRPWRFDFRWRFGCRMRDRERLGVQRQPPNQRLLATPAA